MNRLRRILVFSVFACLILAMYACQTPAGRTAGQVVDDATITTKVKAKLLHDSILSGFAISVNTFEGEVTLNGAVNSVKIKDRASLLSRSVIGVREVHNLLKIKE
ncbi:MAG: BON domain-containing protein [Desulfatiglandaceae bacterium]|jgi:hyperosmotically inducible protein